MSRTDKDHPDARRKNWQNVYTPSWFYRGLRRAARTAAKQDMRNRREPPPDYPKRHDYYW